MVRKKSDRSKDEKNNLLLRAVRALVRDASEVRSLIERAQRLLRGESSDAIEMSLARTQRAASDERADVDERADAPLPDPNVFVSPKPQRAERGDEPIDEQSDGDDVVPIDALPEAFFTTTMGTLLLSQGRALDARMVFERVLAKHPADQEALRGLAKAHAAIAAAHKSPPSSGTRRRSHGVQPHLLSVDEGEAKEPEGLLERADPPLTYDVDELQVLPVDPTTLVAFWEVRASTLKKLEDEQGIHGELMLRVVTLFRGEDGSMQRIERFEGPIPRVGDWFVWSVCNGASHEVSVGVMGRVGFTPLLTVQPVQTPRGVPARTRAVVRARIVLPERTTTVAASVSRIAEVMGPSSVIDALRESRDTVALEGARFVHERPAWLEEDSLVPTSSSSTVAAAPVEHWSEAGIEGAHLNDEPLDPWMTGDVELGWGERAPGSSWGVVAHKTLVRTAGSPSAPWSAR